MTKDYDYYNPLADTYDPYTSAPYYQYLFTDPSGLAPQGPITSKKDAVGEQLAPGSTGIYAALPPPPKKFGITTSETFVPGIDGPSVGAVAGGQIDFNTIIIILLIALVWFLVYRTGKMMKCIKKLKKMFRGKGSSSPNVSGSHDEDDSGDSFY